MNTNYKISCFSDIPKRFCAAVFMEGKILTGYEHGQIIKDYLSENQKHSEWESIENKGIAFFHVCKNPNTVYIDVLALTNIESFIQVRRLVKNSFPDYKIVYMLG